MRVAREKKICSMLHEGVVRVSERGELLLHVPLLYTVLPRSSLYDTGRRQHRMREISLLIETHENPLSLDGSKAVVHCAQLNLAPLRWRVDVFPIYD